MTRQLTQLELRLEKSAAGKTDSEIYRAILGVIEDEESSDEIDVSLLSEALDAALAFGGESSEAVASRVSEKKRALIAGSHSAKRTASTKRRGIRWKIIIPLAAALAIISSFAVVSIATGRSIADMTNYLWQSLVPGAKIDYGDLVIEKSVGARGYEEFSELFDQEGIEGVKVPVEVEISDLLVVEYAGYREITATFTDADGKNYDFEAQYPSQVQSINAQLTRIGSLDVSLTSYDGVCQAEFISGDVFYIIRTDDAEALTALLTSFGE